MSDPIREALIQALAWGATYGPKIAHSDWDEMRDKMVEQYLGEIRSKTKWHSLVEAASDVIFWDGNERATTAFKVLEDFVIQHSHLPPIQNIKALLSVKKDHPCTGYHARSLDGPCSNCGGSKWLHD